MPLSAARFSTGGATTASLELPAATLTHTAAVARLGHALSDHTRTRILLALREAPACPSDLAGALGVSRQVMSNQLSCLRGCGLVESVKEGRRTWYRLADDSLGPALDGLLSLTLAVDPDCCGPECTCS
ncbi:ArsR/SmtB family transcription factor [Ruania rhizosphaerae]|uniref:ArsR/SmtB family transcription factor n=1 Tax=Ruania rhizosphaerae TaxID=1840413 RepID=UPI00190F4FA0|nr:metalloregulator ArsR/SmtB family transcription factor [Ruania rhizosphaerae]